MKFPLLIAAGVVALGSVGYLSIDTPFGSGNSASQVGIKSTNLFAATVEESSNPQRHDFPKTAAEYAKMVEDELGVPPKVILDEAIEIPIYLNGVQKFGNLGTSCDNPTRLGKETISGCVIQRYEGRTAEGKRLKDVVWVAFGRNSSDNPKYIIGSVQMIGYNKTTGATAFFESSDRLSPWVTLDERTLRMRGTMPWVDDPDEFNRAFKTPGNVQCVECHQADPFITNTFINAAKIPGTKEPVVPILDADSPYYVIGGNNWDMRTINIEGNSCFECHRIGQSTLKLFTGNGWDPNKHMPPYDPGSLSEDLAEILEVIRKGPENVKGAQWVIPPARGKGTQVVSDDYPNKSYFNQLDIKKDKFGKKEDWKDKDFGKEDWKDEEFGKKSKEVSEEEKLEIDKLLKQLPDAETRRAFKAWFDKNGVDSDTLNKLREMVKSGKDKGK